MKTYVGIVLRALAIVVIASAIGLGVNTVSPNRIPWVYSPPKEVVVGDHRIPLIDEQRAFELFAEGDAIFLDTREHADFAESHVEGALSLPEPEKQERFVAVAPLLRQDAPIVLYCTGPECEMAEHVAVFLAQLGYSNLMIMSSGMPGWKEAGYPVAGDAGK